MMTSPAMRFRDPRARVAAGVCILAMLALTRAVPAWYRWTTELRSDARELAAEVARADHAITAASITLDSLAQRNARFLALAPALLDGDTPASAGAVLAGVVSGAAAIAGVRLASVRLRPDSATSGTFTRVAVQGEIVGDIDGVMTFLATLERGPLLLAVRELAVTQTEPAAPPERAEVLRAQISVEGLALNRRTRVSPPARHE
jgi:hypothetical protein